MAEWRSLFGFEGYYMISNEGQVMRVAPGRHGGTRPGYVLRSRVDRKGYHSVMPCVDGKTKVVSLHRAVLLAFKGEPPIVGMEANHEDGNKANCHLNNLSWVTNSENKKHAMRTGLRKRLFSKEDITQIKAWYASGRFSQQAIADFYGVSQRHISFIVRGDIYTEDTFS